MPGKLWTPHPGIKRVAPATHRRRRRSTGAPSSGFNAGSIAGNIVWYAARKETAYVDGNAVGTMTDWSTGGHDATQGTAAAKPTYKTDILDGDAVFRFDGGDSVATASFSVVQPLTIFLVLNYTTDATQYALTWNTSAFSGFFRYNTAINLMGFAAGSIVNWTTDMAINDFIIVGMVLNGASSLAYKSGGSDVDGGANPGTGGIVNGLKVGISQAGANNWFGDIAEIVIYDTALSAANINIVGDGLADQYGLTWSAVS